MFNYIFPIFTFGLVISGIVFLGLQQAAHLAKNFAAESREAENQSKPPAAISSEVNSAAVQVPTNKSRP